MKISFHLHHNFKGKVIVEVELKKVSSRQSILKECQQLNSNRFKSYASAKNRMIQVVNELQSRCENFQMEIEGADLLCYTLKVHNDDLESQLHDTKSILIKTQTLLEMSNQAAQNTILELTSELKESRSEIQCLRTTIEENCNVDKTNSIKAPQKLESELLSHSLKLNELQELSGTNTDSSFATRPLVSNTVEDKHESLGGTDSEMLSRFVLPVHNSRDMRKRVLKAYKFSSNPKFKAQDDANPLIKECTELPAVKVSDKKKSCKDVKALETKTIKLDTLDVLYSTTGRPIRRTVLEASQKVFDVSSIGKSEPNSISSKKKKNNGMSKYHLYRTNSCR